MPSNLLNRPQALGCMRDMLQRWEWQLGITLTFSFRVKYTSGCSMVRDYFNRISSPQIAGEGNALSSGYVMVVSMRYNVIRHVHALILGVSPDLAVSRSFRRQIVANWDYHAKVKKVPTQRQACSYLGSHLFNGENLSGEVDFFNHEYLMTIPEPGSLPPMIDRSVPVGSLEDEI